MQRAHAHTVLRVRRRQPAPVRGERDRAEGPVWPRSTPRLTPVPASHSRTVPSSPAVATVVPSGLNTAWSTAPRWPTSTRSATSSRRSITLGRPVSSVTTRRSGVGSNATSLPLSAREATSAPSRQSHTFARRRPTVVSIEPSAFHSIRSIFARCAWVNLARRDQSVASHTLTAPPPALTASRRASGDHAVPGRARLAAGSPATSASPSGLTSQTCAHLWPGPRSAHATHPVRSPRRRSSRRRWVAAGPPGRRGRRRPPARRGRCRRCHRSPGGCRPRSSWA